MIVEDELVIAQDVQRMVSRLGFQCDLVVESGEEAVAGAQRHRPDLILMDIRLGGRMDGIQAATHIHNRLQIPVVFLTAHTDEATVGRAKSATPYGYVVKPVAEQELRLGIEMALAKAEAERLHAEHEQWLDNLVSSVADGVIATGADGTVTHLNREAERICKWPAADARLKAIDEIMELQDEQGIPLFKNLMLEVMAAEVRREWAGDFWLVTRTGARVPVEYTASVLRNPAGKPGGLVLVIRDVSERRQREAEREKLIRDLRESRQNIKTLVELLPICASCKKVRTDDGYWHQVEAYLAQHTNLTFSHGICPECLRARYPEFAEEILRGLESKPAADAK